MKIQLISDTHGYDYDLSEEADVIVHAGDFSNGPIGVFEFAIKCDKISKPGIVALGNHDFYRKEYFSLIQRLESHNLNILTKDNSIVIDGYTFVGGTLFTNFRANHFGDSLELDNAKQLAEQSVYDFYQVMYKDKLVCANDYHTLFNQYYNNIQKYKNKDKVVVVTHFPPSEKCTDPKYANSTLNPYFINDFDLTGYKLWLCGHTHHAFDIEVDNCRVVCNPLGYRSEQGFNGFKSNLIIDLP